MGNKGRQIFGREKNNMSSLGYFTGKRGKKDKKSNS